MKILATARICLAAAYLINLAIAQTFTDLPVEPTCSSPKQAIFIQRPKKGIGGGGGKTVAGSSLEACAGQCKSQTCAAFEFSSTGCVLRDTLDPKAITDSASGNLFLKQCVDSKNVCGNAYHFEGHPQKELVGYARRVEKAPDFATCYKLCLDNQQDKGWPCKSIMYFNKDQECLLNTEDHETKPDLWVAETKDEVWYFANKCGEKTCKCQSSTGSFFIGKQQVLVGYAAWVIEGVPSLEACENQCLNPPKQLQGGNFKCRSGMYYYKEQECILNTETRKTKPDLYVPESESTKVDYFEPEGECSCGPPLDIRCTFSGIDIRYTNPQGPFSGAIFARNKFPTCRTEINNANQGSLLLPLPLAISAAGPPGGGYGGDQGYGGGAPIGAVDGGYGGGGFGQPPGILPQPPGGYGGGPVQPSGGTYGGGQPQPVGGAGYGSSQAPSSYGGSPPAIQPQAPAGYSAAPIQPAQTGYAGGVPQPSPAAGYSGPSQPSSGYAGGSVPSPQSGYSQAPSQASAGYGASAAPKPGGYRQKRQSYSGVPTASYGGGPSASAPSSYGSSSVPQPPTGGSYGGGSPPAADGYGGGSVGGPPSILPQAPGGYGSVGDGFGSGPVAPPSAGYGGSQPSSGGYGSAPEVNLADCGVVCAPNGTCSATVIVQNNPFGIPGLVTSMDGIYTVSCDYGPGLSQKVIAMPATFTVNNKPPVEIKPRGKIQLGSPVNMGLSGATFTAGGSAGGYGGSQGGQAVIGDILELTWEMLASDVGFFVDTCVATPVGFPGLSSPGGYGGDSFGGYGGGGGGFGAGSGSGYGGTSGGDSYGGSIGGSFSSPGILPQAPGGGGSYGGGSPPAVGGYPAPSQGSYGASAQPPVAPPSYGGAPAAPATSGSYGASPVPPQSQLYGASAAPPAAGYGGAAQPSPSQTYGASPAPPAASYGNSAPSPSQSYGAAPVTPGNYGKHKRQASPPTALPPTDASAAPPSALPPGGSAAGSPSASGAAPPSILPNAPGGAPAQPIPALSAAAIPSLVLVQRGCVTPAVATKLMPKPITPAPGSNGKILRTNLQAFRFDGTRTVQIQCTLKLCNGPCPPVTCISNSTGAAGNGAQSWGKKKRSADLSNFNEEAVMHDEKAETFEVGRYVVPRVQRTSACFTIVDKLSDIKPAESNYHQSSNFHFDGSAFDSKRYPAEITSVRHKGDLCLPKSTFMGVSVLFGLLAVAQVSVIGIYASRRLKGKKQV